MESIAIIVGAGSWVGVGTLIFCMIRYFPSQRFCDSQHEHNKTDHESIKGWIEENEKRAEKRHTEYREDMRELKELIKNNGNSRRPRIQT